MRVGIDVDRQQDLDNFTAGLNRPSFNFANIVDFAVDHPSTQNRPVIDVTVGGTAKSLYSRVLMLQMEVRSSIGFAYDVFGDALPQSTVMGSVQQQDLS
jgi:hypothetical protein